MVSEKTQPISQGAFSLSHCFEATLTGVQAANLNSSSGSKLGQAFCGEGGTCLIQNPAGGSRKCKQRS